LEAARHRLTCPIPSTKSRDVKASPRKLTLEKSAVSASQKKRQHRDLNEESDVKPILKKIRRDVLQRSALLEKTANYVRTPMENFAASASQKRKGRRDWCGEASARESRAKPAQGNHIEYMASIDHDSRDGQHTLCVKTTNNGSKRQRRDMVRILVPRACQTRQQDITHCETAADTTQATGHRGTSKTHKQCKDTETSKISRVKDAINDANGLVEFSGTQKRRNDSLNSSQNVTGLRRSSRIRKNKPSSNNHTPNQGLARRSHQKVQVQTKSIASSTTVGKYRKKTV
jgi:hypothetical protein